MKKILIRGPLLSQSGYGEHARFLFNALRQREDVDLYAITTNWGATGWLPDFNEERAAIDATIAKTVNYLQAGGKFDASCQVTIPNEWVKLAPVNIGVTAGIETDKISRKWVELSSIVDKIIVPSTFAKQGFDKTSYKVKDQFGKERDFRCHTPVSVVGFPVKDYTKTTPIKDFDLQHDFNFLVDAQWGPRKNLEMAIKGFIEENYDQEVGLVLKVSIANNSLIDHYHTQERLEGFIHQAKEKYKECKCQVYLLHGQLTEEELCWLYQHPKIKAIVSTSHGEGWGLPLYRAACCALPIISPEWSGLLDFVSVTHKKRDKKKDKTIEVTEPFMACISYTLRPVQKEAVWKDIIEPDALWCYPEGADYRRALRDVRKNYTFYASQARRLQADVLPKFALDKQLDEMYHAVVSNRDVEKVQLVNDASVCIITNGKNVEKTNAMLKNLQLARQKSSIDVEVIVCGKTESLDIKEVGEVTLVQSDSVDGGFLGKARNEAASHASKSVLVFADDDLLFDERFFERLKEYSATNPWKVLGTRILLPSGGRFWDRATINPHVMVSYDHLEIDKNLYQTGGFWVIRKDVYEEEKWNDDIPINAAERKLAPYNEDVEYSLRLHRKGINFSFDEYNTVWHNDTSYIQYQNLALKKEIVERELGQVFDENEKNEEYVKLVGLL